MDYEFAVEIDAAPDEVWMALTDVERWPEWTPSMTRVERLDPGPFQVGSTARIKQPRFPAVVWRVTELEPGQSFSWTASGSGVTTLAGHRITPRGDGVEVTLSVRQTGPLAWLAGLITSRLTQRYVQMEANGLKRRSEEEVP
ncbi:MAG: hypothetical protein QOD01_2178 [Actinomycetota bacterium]|nr:hypothetical protein [Actinomycetota bacterium]